MAPMGVKLNGSRRVPQASRGVANLPKNDAGACSSTRAVYHVFRVDIFLDFVRLTTRTIDPPWGVLRCREPNEIELAPIGATLNGSGRVRSRRATSADPMQEAVDWKPPRPYLRRQAASKKDGNEMNGEMK